MNTHSGEGAVALTGILALFYKGAKTRWPELTPGLFNQVLNEITREKGDLPAMEMNNLLEAALVRKFSSLS